MKQRILLIVALIIIVANIIRTLIISYTFLDYSNNILKREILTFKKFLKLNNTNTKKTIKELKTISQDITKIELIPIQHKNTTDNIKNTYLKIKLDWKHKQFIGITNFDKNHYLKIVFSGKNYYEKFINALLQLFIISISSLIVILLIINHFLNPYLELLEKNKIYHFRFIKRKF